MKILFTILILAFVNTFAFSQTEKTLTKSVAVNETHTAFVILPGDVALTEWNESFIRITTTINVENMSENIIKRLLVLGRYSVETKEDKFGKMIVIKMPKVYHNIAVKGVQLIETYSFRINVPSGYKVVVKEDLNPNARQSPTLGPAVYFN
jgi:hypothetical protein